MNLPENLPANLSLYLSAITDVPPIASVPAIITSIPGFMLSLFSKLPVVPIIKMLIIGPSVAPL